jgi:RHS repeat-associated protein
VLESQRQWGDFYDTRFKFNGKELDDETGNYYYGARYMDPKTSIWLSVDPKAYAFPHLSPYNFMMNNPINVIDPRGDSAWTVNVETGQRNYVDDRGGAEQQIVSYINNDGHDLGTKVIDGGDFHHGKIDGGYLASGTNLWVSDGSVNFGAIAQNEGMTKSLMSSGKRSLDFKLDLMSASIGEAQADFLRTGAEVSAYALQQTGDVAALAGYGLTLTGVGAPIGIPLAGLGTGMSVAGGGIQAGLHFMDGNNGAGAKTLLFTAGSAGATALPGKGLGYEVLRQNLGLKISGANRLIGD